MFGQQQESNPQHQRLRHHASHDAQAIVSSWLLLARKYRWSVETLAETACGPVVAVCSPALLADSSLPCLYVSAGVHGDEAAPPTALLEWFMENGQSLKNRPVILFPLMNPEGLAANVRTLPDGEDLNRQFHNQRRPLIKTWHSKVSALNIRLSLCLHEDYDAQGCYAYELRRLRQKAIGHRFLDNVEAVMPRDGRKLIDTRKAKNGLIERTKLPTDLPGLPEALVLYHLGAQHNLTFETPSEAHLEDRIQAQRKFIEAAVKWMGWAS